MDSPTLLLDRPPAVQVATAVGGPVVLGALAGWLLGASAIGYWIVSGVAGIGGLMSGLEHPNADEAAGRGFLGGMVFGSVILAVHAAIGDDAKIKLSHPHVGLVIATTIGGAILAAIGGAIRRRRDRRERAAEAEAEAA